MQHYLPNCAACPVLCMLCGMIYNWNIIYVTFYVTTVQVHSYGITKPIMHCNKKIIVESVRCSLIFFKDFSRSLGNCCCDNYHLAWVVCGISSYSCLIIYLVGAGKIANSSIHIYKHILTYDGIKYLCLHISLLIVSLADSCQSRWDLLMCRCNFCTSKIVY